MNQLTALELDAGSKGVTAEGEAGTTDGGKAYLTLEEYKTATAAGNGNDGCCCCCCCKDC